MIPKVWNKYDPERPQHARYIGRGSPCGNPFKIGDFWKGRPMTRDDVCDRFKAEILPTLDVEYLRGQDIYCFCKPLRCHGDDILVKANS